MRDGNLRSLFVDHLPHAHWVPIETWSTGQGVPDTEYCFPGGQSGWIEFKVATGNRVRLSPQQLAWIERRHRTGGRVFVAVRKKQDLLIFSSAVVRDVYEHGLQATVLLRTSGGPARWSWKIVEYFLTK